MEWGSWWELMGVEHSWTVGKAILLLWRSVFWSLESLDMAVPAPLISCGSPEGPAGTWAKSLPLAVKSVGPGSEGEGLGARPEAGWDLDTCGHWVAWWTNFRCAECKRYLRYQWYDVKWRDMMWYDVIWCDMMWYDVIWYDMFGLVLGCSRTITGYKMIQVHSHTSWEMFSEDRRI
jgi:hypothetical protein